jgi:uncharacterized protein YgbK (DUF1537 family)
MIFGAIADDYTGGSDLAGMLAERGVRTLMHFGVPERAVQGTYDAAVVCLKSRSIAAADARAMSARAFAWLQSAGARQIQFKYCSTFDSTAAGNIGPVLDELLELTRAPYVVVVPALPVNGRTQYLGHLFVNGVLLAESPMRHHPLNPMTDSNLVRHLAAQTRSTVGLIPLPVVQSGAEAIRRHAVSLGVRMLLVDAVCESDLAHIAEAIADSPLISGGSGVAAHLPAFWHTEAAAVMSPPLEPSGVLMLAGSCSAATLEQIARYGPAIHFQSGESVAATLERTGRALVHSSAPPDRRLPLESAASIEKTLAGIAVDMVDSHHVRRIIVAGGETAGAVVDALGIKAVEVLRVLSPGVPALRTLGAHPLALVLKSGNFGRPDFFSEAAAYLETL